jgi:hypothetical protein
MWIWIAGGYAITTVVLVCYATHVALAKPDRRHRADAYRVLKLLMTTVGGSAGLIGVLVRLHEVGIW